MLLFVQPSETEQKTKGGRGKSGLRLAQSSRTPLFLFQAIAQCTRHCVCKIHTFERERETMRKYKTDRQRGFNFFSSPSFLHVV
jgi:hypothetical protein